MTAVMSAGHRASSVRRVLGAGLALLLVSLGSVSLPGRAAAQDGEDAADKAAREIAAARERANEAAAAFLEAESQLEQLELQQERLTDEVAELELQVEDLRDTVESVAINRFMSSGATGIPILTDLRGPNEQVQAVVLGQVVAESGATTIDDYDAASERLADKRDELEDNQRQVETSKEELAALQADAEAEVERLREIEAERLEDEAVQAALAAQQLEQQRQLEELQRRQAEAARAASGQLGVAPPAAVTAAAASGATSGNIGASGGAAGGRTGGGGAGSNPRAAGDGYLDTIICPVLGGSAYGDTWGAPRSGGRRHQGVDMLAPTGTPLQAVVAGTLVQGTNRLGGVVVTLHGVNGNRYYYAHLSAYEGLAGPVTQGQVIGYVGDTGNAVGTPHLHFEIHPHEGVAVNPYPSVRAAGC
jgi:murein DD-endopeptidase MepM/ murein hydrolase activator NlpD